MEQRILQAMKVMNKAHQLQLQSISEDQNISDLERIQRQIEVVERLQAMTESFQSCVRMTGVGDRAQPPPLEADKDLDMEHENMEKQFHQAIEAINDAFGLQLRKLLEDPNTWHLERIQRMRRVVVVWRGMINQILICMKATGIEEHAEHSSLEADKDQGNLSDGAIDK